MISYLSRLVRRAIPLFVALAAISSPLIAWAADEAQGLHYYYPTPTAKAPQVVEADICVYGGTPGGVAAAVQAARMGKKTVLVVFRRHVGGMTSGGLTATDLGNAAAIGGLAQEFYRRLGKPKDFRPSEPEEAFRALLKDASVPVYFEQRLKKVTKNGDRIAALLTESGATFKAAMFVDATYFYSAYFDLPKITAICNKYTLRGNNWLINERLEIER